MARHWYMTSKIGSVGSVTAEERIVVTPYHAVSGNPHHPAVGTGPGQAPAGSSVTAKAGAGTATGGAGGAGGHTGGQVSAFGTMIQAAT